LPTQFSHTHFNTTGEACNSWSASLLLVTPGVIPCQHGHEQESFPKNISIAEAEGDVIGVDEGLDVTVGVAFSAGHKRPASKSTTN